MQGLRQNLREIPRLLLAYQAVLALFAVALASFAIQYGLDDPWTVIGLAAVGAIAERGRVSLGNSAEASISLLPTVFAAAVLGPLAGLLVAAASLAGDFSQPLPASRPPPRQAEGERGLKGGGFNCI